MQTDHPAHDKTLGDEPTETYAGPWIFPSRQKTNHAFLLMRRQSPEKIRAFLSDIFQ
jgi:hypothetical protein